MLKPSPKGEGFNPPRTRTMKAETNFSIIGIVKSPVDEQRDYDWGNVVSEIHLEARYTRGLLGVDEFSHLLIVFLMHESTFDATNDLVRHPRGLTDLPETGIFAQRAKHRPNPIGVTSVQLLNVEANVIKVQGLDAIDGTPVLDIKPYFPVFDSRSEASVPDWVEQIMSDYF